MMKLIIVGDFYYGEGFMRYKPKSPLDVFGTFLDYIQDADLSIFNLESPIIQNGNKICKTGPALKSNVNAAKFLKETGFGLAALANNHIMDYGELGLKSTLQHLNNNDIEWVGAGNSYREAVKPFVCNKLNDSVAILNFTENEWSTTIGDRPGASPIDPVRNYYSIRNALSLADNVVVISHGGHEGYNMPSPKMKELFHYYIDAGARVVINHHPHCVSGYEAYGDGIIFYSIGNFLFDKYPEKTGEWSKGAAVEINIQKQDLLWRIHHFEQNTDHALFKMYKDDQSQLRDNYILTLNKTISDDSLLAIAFSKMAMSRSRQYSRYLEPTSNRYILAAQSYGLLPSFIPKAKRNLILNLLRCESHREIVEFILAPSKHM